MNNHIITNLGTPTNDTDAPNKKHVDDKKCKCKDGTSTTLDIDLRSDGFHDDITFNAKAYCQDLDSTATSKSIINKNTLETGHLITMNSITPSLARMLQMAIKKELLVLQGHSGNFAKIYADPSVNGEPSFTSGASSVELTVSFKNDLPNGIYKYAFDIILATTAQSVKVFLYGECGGSGYKATTTYEHWDGTTHGTTKQTNVSDGYFHRMYGKHVHITGSFRNYGEKIINYGKSYARNDNGAYNEFVLQKIVANSSEPQVLGLDMTWLFENETAGSGITLDRDSYFYMEKVQTI